jgi:hypothetical protein
MPPHVHYGLHGLSVAGHVYIGRKHGPSTVPCCEVYVCNGWYYLVLEEAGDQRGSVIQDGGLTSVKMKKKQYRVNSDFHVNCSVLLHAANL